MRMSDMVAQRILELLKEQDGFARNKRGELAEDLGCVPSQINYVLTSRFTPEHGYTVESRRGGGGYIRITRVKVDRSTAVMHLVNSIGDSIDFATAKAVVGNLSEQGFISRDSASVMLAAMNDHCYRGFPAGAKRPSRQHLKTNAHKLNERKIYMLCEKCGKRQATTHQKSINGVYEEHHYCSKCAAENGGKLPPFGAFGENGLFSSLLGLPFSAPAQRSASDAVRCPSCGTSFAEISQSGRVGCAKCCETPSESSCSPPSRGFTAEPPMWARLPKPSSPKRTNGK